MVRRSPGGAAWLRRRSNSGMKRLRRSRPTVCSACRRLQLRSARQLSVSAGSSKPVAQQLQQPLDSFPSPTARASASARPVRGCSWGAAITSAKWRRTAHGGAPVRLEGVPVGEAQREGEPQPVVLGLRQVLRLLVRRRPGSRARCRAGTRRPPQLRDRRCGRRPRRPKQLQHHQQVALLQRGLAAAADQLEGLRDELDLANAAGAELDVVVHAAALHLAVDHRLHAAQRSRWRRNRGSGGR